MITVNVKSEIVGSDIKISTDMQANNEAIEQLRLDNKDLSRLLRECNATRQKDDWK